VIYVSHEYSFVRHDAPHLVCHDHTETINFLASQRTATASASSFTMVQGLAFLSKKSWHTKNLNNQEKVWVAEERKKAEARKTQELQKQIQQELEQQELDAIAGRTIRRDRGIDWMYEHGPTSETARMDSEKKSEEYLLGKEFVPEGAPKGDLDVDKAQDGVNKVVSSASAAAAAASYSREDASGTEHAPELSVKERNEAFTLRFEDPMFMVARRAVDIERKLERKKQLLKRVTGAVAVDLADVDIKRKKEKKKKRDRGDKKSSKKRRRSPSVDSPSDDSGRSEGRRYRKKSPPRKRDRSSSPATTGSGARVPRATAMNLANWTVAVDHAASVRLFSGTGVVATNWAQMTKHTTEPIPQDRIDSTVDEKIGVESATEATTPMKNMTHPIGTKNITSSGIIGSTIGSLRLRATRTAATSAVIRIAGTGYKAPRS
jgi:N-terminal domain of CBF1 interacting co-repressor CIR/Pre-mRNA splicing factor